MDALGIIRHVWILLDFCNVNVWKMYEVKRQINKWRVQLNVTILRELVALSFFIFSRPTTVIQAVCSKPA